MAFLKLEQQSAELSDGQPVLEAAEALGVPFGCRQGRCGTCQVEVTEGMENLNPLTEAEQFAAETGMLEKNQRRMCQCRILQGAVSIKFI